MGSGEKLNFIKEELNFDGGYNYKQEKPAKPWRHLPFVGEQLDAAIAATTNYGHISDSFGA